MLTHGSHIFTSESVSEGHPDKVCDQISDAILDACLAQDPQSRVACEVFATTDRVVVGGELSTKATIDIEQIVRSTVKEIGYTDKGFGFDYHTLTVMDFTNTQSPDISMGVSAETSLYGQQGAGDQGMMFGYACNETECLMPAPIYWAHQLLERASMLRKSGEAPFLRPDAKSQVSLLYQEGKPVHIDSVVISHQHTEQARRDTLIPYLTKEVIEAVLMPTGLLNEKTKMYINPTGRFVTGGPAGDTGLTGRKSLSIPMAAWAAMGGEPLVERIPPRLTAAVPTWLATLQRTWWQMAYAQPVRSNSPMQLEFLIPSVSMSIPLELEQRTMNSWKNWCGRSLTSLLQAS